MAGMLEADAGGAQSEASRAHAEGGDEGVGKVINGVPVCETCNFLYTSRLQRGRVYSTRLDGLIHRYSYLYRGCCDGVPYRSIPISTSMATNSRSSAIVDFVVIEVATTRATSSAPGSAM